MVVPKDGEQYADTIKRAIQHYHSLSDEEQKSQIEKESAHPVEKTAETLAAAGGIGLAGPAILAAAGDVVPGGAGYQVARNFVMQRLAAGTPTLFGEEAAKATLKRLAVKAAGKMVTGGLIVGGGAILHDLWEEMFGGK